MTHEQILNKVKQVTAETLDLDADSITEQTNLKELGADSFDLLELVTAFEDEFGLTIDDDALESIATVADAVNAIESAQQQ